MVNGTQRRPIMQKLVCCREQDIHNDTVFLSLTMQASDSLIKLSRCIGKVSNNNFMSRLLMSRIKQG